MPSWTNPGNGGWTDASKWTGGVPDAAGAVANFTVADAGGASSLIFLSQNEDITVGTLNIVTDANDAWRIQAVTGTTLATLRFQGAGGAPAFLTVQSDNTNAISNISGVNGLRVVLDSDLIVTTINSVTAFDIAAPISGGRDLYKFGDGTFRLSGSNPLFTGDMFLNAGRLEVVNGSALGSSNLIKIINDATLAAGANVTLSSKIETGSGNAEGNIVAETGITLTLTGQLELRGSASNAVTFGSAADTGTILLSGTSLVNGTGGFFIGGGTVRFGNAGAAANYFASLSTTNSIVAVQTGAVFDTGGFAAVIDNLAATGGTLQSTGGALDVTSDHSFAAASLSGTIIGTAQADRLIFNVAGGLNLGSLIFNSWTNGPDTITLNGNDIGNFLSGSTRNDTINGGGGNDTLVGAGGVDTIRGGAGDDLYNIVDALSTLIENAGEGTDTIRVLTGGPAVFTLADNFENLLFDGSAQHSGTGNSVANVLTGGGGVDQLFGLGGNDTLFGNADNDILDGGTGADAMEGGAGNDSFIIDQAGDVIVELAGGGTNDIALVQAAHYALGAGVQVETLSTANATGTAAINLTGNELGNSIFGNEGDNLLLGNGGIDQLTGHGGNDVLVGGTGADVMRGGLGNDLYGIDEQDLIFENAGEGDDSLAANIGSYFLNDGASIETLTTANQAGTFAQNLTGNELGQSISGSDGANVLNGMGGNDLLRGYGGADIFLFDTAAGLSNHDVIADVAVGVDKIALQNAVFTGLAEGNLGANAFRVGSAAQDADDRIIWNAATNQLFFDADGNGAGAAILFAIVNGSPNLQASDFIIV